MLVSKAVYIYVSKSMATCAWQRDRDRVRIESCAAHTQKAEFISLGAPQWRNTYLPAKE